LEPLEQRDCGDIESEAQSRSSRIRRIIVVIEAEISELCASNRSILHRESPSGSK